MWQPASPAASSSRIVRADIFRAAKSGVGIDDRRNLDRVRDVTGQPHDLSQREQADVGHACGRVGDARAANINRVEPGALHLPRHRRVRHARHRDTALRDQFPQARLLCFSSWPAILAVIDSELAGSRATLNASTLLIRTSPQSCISSLTFLASSSFQARSDNLRSRFILAELGTTSALNFPSNCSIGHRIHAHCLTDNRPASSACARRAMSHGQCWPPPSA